MSDVLPMSQKELERAQVLRALDEGYLKQRQARDRLGPSVRQIQRLLKAYRRDGAAALVSKKRGLTQFGRALQDLDIELICANSPQAKGRVEHANGVLQDRLVKEMWLRGIATMTEANAYGPEFIADFNRRFAKAPREAHDAHRPLRRQDDLARILTVQETRSLSKNLTLQYQRVIYQIQTMRPSYALRHATVLVRENATGEVMIEYKGKPLAYTVHHEQARQGDISIWQ